MPLLEIQLSPEYSLVIEEQIDAIGEQQWSAINPQLPFFQTFQFLKAIEYLQTEITFRYVLVLKNKQVLAILYFQVFDFSYSNLVKYNNENSTGLKNKFKKIIAKKKVRLLNLGNIFFTGDKGVICNDENQVLPFVPTVIKYCRETFATQKPNAFLVANITLQNTNNCKHFGKNNFHSFTTEPDVYMQINKQWNTYTDYLNALSSKYRVRANKVRNSAKNVYKKTLSLAEITTYKQDINHLYNNVVNHVAFNMAVLNIDFFEKMKAMYGNSCTINAYFLEDKLIGFACIFDIDKQTLHIHYIGLDYALNQQYKLYNNMLLDFVEHAILHKKQQIHFGRTATEIKTTVGAQPYPLQAYLKMNNSLLNASLPYFLNRIKPPEYTVRNPFREI